MTKPAIDGYVNTATHEAIVSERPSCPDDGLGLIRPRSTLVHLCFTSHGQVDTDSIRFSMQHIPGRMA